MATLTAEPAQSADVANPPVAATTAPAPARKTLAVLRLATGFIFLWAFLDKTFGLGYSTPSERAWIHGGHPAQGFLLNLEGGPLKGFFEALATPAVDVLFMIGMFCIGVAVMAGAGTRIAAVAGTVVMAFMWLAEWPLAANASSSNPIIDYHVIYALALIVLALLNAGDYWGLGRWWKSLGFVQKNPWLI